MNYCPVCMILTSEKKKCPSCRKKRLVSPKDNDPVFLTTKEAIWASMVEDVLGREKIPYLKKEAFRYGISAGIIGYANEYYSFYVPYAALARATEMVDALFASDGTDASGSGEGSDADADNEIEPEDKSSGESDEKKSEHTNYFAQFALYSMLEEDDDDIYDSYDYDDGISDDDDDYDD
ncbi:MAG: hypothetical protein WBI55_04740 [Eubacteriales bacterium]|jgi:hypothetical protein|nr:hypothetical protein [Clostridiales bacterium]